MKSSKYYVPPVEAIHYPEGPGGREVINLKTTLGKTIYRERLTAAWLRDRGFCGICNLPVVLASADPDHIEPKGMGGSRRDDRVDNIQPAHRRCNIEKGSKRLPAHRRSEDGIDFESFNALPF